MTDENASATVKKRRGRPPIVRDFYGSAMDAAHQTTMKYAAKIQDLDQEIALLRTRLRDAVGDTPQSYQLMVRGMELLAKLVATRHRLSKKAEKDIASSAANLLRGLALQFFPETDDAA